MHQATYFSSTPSSSPPENTVTFNPKPITRAIPPAAPPAQALSDPAPSFPSLSDGASNGTGIPDDAASRHLREFVVEPLLNTMRESVRRLTQEASVGSGLRGILLLQAAWTNLARTHFTLKLLQSDDLSAQAKLIAASNGAATMLLRLVDTIERWDRHTMTQAARCPTFGAASPTSWNGPSSR